MALVSHLATNNALPAVEGERILGVAGMLPVVTFNQTSALLTSCLVAERCWDAARWAIKAYAWRFEGVRRRATRRAR